MADIPGVKITTDTNQEREMTVTLQNGFFLIQGVKIWALFLQQQKKR